MRSCLTLFKKREGFFLCCVVVLILLLYLPQVFLREAILCDAALRCAPMAEWFFHQSFSAFHSGSFFVAPDGEKFSENKWRKIAENLPFGKIKLNLRELKK